MRRRTTLGNIGGAQLNRGSARPSLSAKGGKSRRFSMATSASQGAKRASNADRRQSMNGRRSSSGIRSGTISGLRGDPRPISDRTFINSSIRALINYLMDHEYGQALSPKILTRPTQRDFQNIMTFLFHQIDANLPMASKFEDEVLIMFRSLHYPFSISKTSLHAVGSPHTWPHLLASITWMIELLEYDEKVADAEEENLEKAERATGPEDENLSHKAFFSYLGKAYTAFLSGEDEIYTELEEDFVGRITGKNEAASSAMDALASDIASLKEEIEAVKSRRDELPELQQRHADLEEDKAKFGGLITRLEEHKASLANKVQSRSGDISLRKEEISALKASISALKDTVSRQELSPEDVERMRSERERLQEGMEAASALRAQEMRKLQSEEAELARSLESLESSVQDYKARASALGLPARALHLSVDRGAAADAARSRSELLSVDVHAQLKAVLSDAKDDFARRRQSARQSLLNALDEDEKGQETVSEICDAAALLEGRVQRAEESYRREKDSLEKTLAALVKDTEDYEQQAHVLRNPGETEERFGVASRRCAALRRQLESSLNQWNVEHATLHRRIFDCLTTIADAKERTERRVAELREFYRHKMAALTERA